jgi:ornithine carbamoyltransferase
MKHFLSVIDCPNDLLKELLRISNRLKSLYSVGGNDFCLQGKTLAMLFEPANKNQLPGRYGGPWR